MAKSITVAEVDQAEADLIQLKATARKRSATGEDVAAYKAAAQSLAELRAAWRDQEEAAGRRVGPVATDGEG